VSDIGDVVRSKGERITIRLPEKDLRLIDSFLMEEKCYQSRSELLRVAARELIDRKIAHARGQQEETFVPVSDIQISAVDYLVRTGRFKSRDAALFEILRNYLETLEWDKIEDTQKRLQLIKYKVASAEMQDKEIEEKYLSH
jgi:Arc/MetJ-type ribon-helix-helix transcriptional regulator